MHRAKKFRTLKGGKSAPNFFPQSPNFETRYYWIMPVTLKRFRRNFKRSQTNGQKNPSTNTHRYVHTCKQDQERQGRRQHRSTAFVHGYITFIVRHDWWERASALLLLLLLLLFSHLAPFSTPSSSSSSSILLVTRRGTMELARISYRHYPVSRVRVLLEQLQIPDRKKGQAEPPTTSITPFSTLVSLEIDTPVVPNNYSFYDSYI